MPTDTKRISGPESSVSPYSFVKETKARILLNSQGVRQDGRKTDTARPVYLKTGTITQAQGSAYMEQQGTKVICAVYGPRAVIKREEFSMKGQLTCEFKFATFACRHRRQHQQNNEEKDFSVQLLEALEPAVLLHKFPKAQLNIYVTVLEDDGSALAAAITAASVALVDAGIELYDLVTGTSVRLLGDKLLMDPTADEEYSAERDSGINQGSVTLGLMPSLNQVSAVTSRGEIQFELIKQAVQQCSQVCVQVYQVCQHVLSRSMEETLRDQT